MEIQIQRDFTTRKRCQQTKEVEVVEYFINDEELVKCIV